MTDLRAQLQATLGDAYALERELGGGGMSRVFVATERKLGRRVVIKVLSHELSASLSAERFAREIQLAASLQQANIVPVLTAGMADDTPYFTMPFVDGESLRTRLTRGPMSEPETVSVLRDVARALVYAHERGVVHRDIKPDNVLLSGESAVVTDFGIAKAITASRTLGGAPDQVEYHSGITQVGMSLGTPAYMAPEQAAGDPATDHRADIYAFGCMAFELLTGRSPFQGRALHEMLIAHIAETAPTVRSLRPEVSPTLDALIARCLAKRPTDRPATARELLTQLDSVVSGNTLNAIQASHTSRQWTLPKATGAWAVLFVSSYVLARAAVVGIGLPSWTVSLVTIVAALGLPAVLVTWYVQRAAQRAINASPTHTPGGSAQPTQHGTMATMAINASPHISWTRTWKAGAVGGSAVIVAIASVLVLRQFGIGPAASLLAGGRIAADSRVLVAEFASVTSDSSLGMVMSQAMRTSLAQSKAVELVTPSDVRAALQRMTLSPSTRVTEQVAREMATRNGIPLVVTGQVASVGTGFVITANLIANDSGTVLVTLQRAANGAGEVLSAIDQLSRDLRARIGESLRSIARAPSLENATTSSLAALREYSRAVQTGDIEADFEGGLTHLRLAVHEDSTFAQAWRKMAVYAFNIGRPRSEQFAGAATAYRFRDHLSAAERAEVEAYYWGRTDTRAAIRAYQAATLAGINLSANNEAVLHLVLGEYAVAELLTNAAIVKDSLKGKTAIVQLHINRAVSQLNLGKITQARAGVAYMQQQFPGAYYAEWGEAMISWTAGGIDSLATSGERLLHSKQILSRQEGAARIAAAAGANGHLTQFRERAQFASVLADSATNTGDPVGTTIFTALPMAVHRREEVVGVARLDSALRANPQDKLPVMDRRDLELAAAYAQLGRADKAKPLIANFERAATHDEKHARWNDWRRAMGEVALAEGRAKDALAEFRSAALADSGILEAAATGRSDEQYARAFDKLGQADSATVYFERVAHRRGGGSYALSPLILPIALRRLGELYEAKDDNGKALDNYQAFVKLWEGADPELQPQVTDVKSRIARLQASEARKR